MNRSWKGTTLGRRYAYGIRFPPPSRNSPCTLCRREHCKSATECTSRVVGHAGYRRL
ncbi:hypothetical protein BD311DRAFT_764132 [Dichomitus squalens]|uniref:Uncharacterized protein n=1 Tax=Dichomitus squalens TaxID=114155 RepID=A0A4Q9MHN0_9APHY|nr:hypothetical protein BD311DRAFT_764132 [Dichomitus squalens]